MSSADGHEVLGGAEMSCEELTPWRLMVSWG